jgi:hypothetical protein
VRADRFIYFGKLSSQANNAKELLFVIFGGLAVVVTGVTVDP